MTLLLCQDGWSATNTWYEKSIPIAPRYQWNTNWGYCGETSFISAGLHYGQYTSQWTARELGCNCTGAAQRKASSQVLLGTPTAMRAANAMMLDTEWFDAQAQESTPEFLAWVKEHFIAGHVVIIGVYNNVNMLNEGGVGQATYDHIVPVLGIGSPDPLDDRNTHFNPADNILISDNGLFTAGSKTPFLYQYRNSDFMKTRAQANVIGGALYGIRKTPKNYGAAVTGILDEDRVTLRVRLRVKPNNEGMQNEPYMSERPPSQPISLTADVEIPDPSQEYNVYLYDDFRKVPQVNFNSAKNQANALAIWRIPRGEGSRRSITIDAMSGDTRIFRAVPAAAP